MCKYTVGRVDGTIDRLYADTYEDALGHITMLQEKDPIGVFKGEYYIDGPEEG